MPLNFFLVNYCLYKLDEENITDIFSVVKQNLEIINSAIKERNLCLMNVLNKYFLSFYRIV